MKLVNPEQMKKAEAELVHAVISNVNWASFRAFFKEKHRLAIGKRLKIKGAEIRIADNEMRYAIDLKVNLDFSIELDREGNFVSIEDGENRLQASENDSGATPAEEYLPADLRDSIADWEILELGTEATGAEINMEKWLKGEDQGGSEGLYEDALKEIGSVDHPKDKGNVEC